MKIMIVDDEVNILEMLRFRLEASGFEVVEAQDGEEAISKAKAEKPDLILLDVMMPRRNGFQTCRALKQDPETQAIRVILLTAKDQESDKYWGHETGADGYVTKPFDAADLMKVIRENLKMPG